MEKEMKSELRKLLTGRTIRDAEGWLIAIPEGSGLIYHGVVDTTGHRRIVSREETLQAAKDSETAFYRVLSALQKIGVLVNMSTKPDALCALRRYLTKAVIVCVSPGKEGQVLAEAYTGRSLFAALYCRRAIGQLKKELEKEETAETN